jgi:signal transduction histidine kinase
MDKSRKTAWNIATEFVRLTLGSVEHPHTRLKGTGLYVARNIVEAHGGKIWAENNSDGKAATFAFNLSSSVISNNVRYA